MSQLTLPVPLKQPSKSSDLRTDARNPLVVNTNVNGGNLLYNGALLELMPCTRRERDTETR